MSFTFTVVDVEEKKIAGITVETNMERSTTDCPALWGTFMPLMDGELAQNAAVIKGAPTYGVSQFIDMDRFVYWAAVEVNSLEGFSADLKTMTIAAGRYVKCVAPSLAQLGETYMALDGWMNAQDKYTYNMQGVALEEYKHAWQMSDSIAIYVAVLEK